MPPFFNNCEAIKRGSISETAQGARLCCRSKSPSTQVFYELQIVTVKFKDRRFRRHFNVLKTTNYSQSFKLKCFNLKLQKHSIYINIVNNCTQWSERLIFDILIKQKGVTSALMLLYTRYYISITCSHMTINGP